MKQSFPPLINQRSHFLILGTLPGEDSLAFQQYYGHRRNHFWRIIGDIIGQPLALWDTVAAANRQGSLDQHIHQPIFNDIPALLRHYPSISYIGFNGKQARRFFQSHESQLPRTITLVDLPSTSPAYTLAYEHKLAAWQQALQSIVKCS
ncbi:MAG: DNA-deoxyinosine glycosylase [Gammaproteobacteria bacterium]|nr:MAG: DNA-deoxyinosine glycosylase [Gammaproteobacteria bacterium]